MYSEHTVSCMYYVRTECVLCKDFIIMVKYIFLEDSRKHSCSTLDFPIGIHDEIKDKQTHTITDRQIQIQTDKHQDRQTPRQTDKHQHRQTVVRLDRWIPRQCRQALSGTKKKKMKRNETKTERKKKKGEIIAKKSSFCD